MTSLSDPLGPFRRGDEDRGAALTSSFPPAIGFAFAADARRRIAPRGARWLARLATPLLLIALPIALFLAFFHASTLQLDNAGWLIRGTDNGENALGAHAYWHDPHAGVSLRTTLLNAPDGVPVLYTDSNPLLTLAAKPIAALLPADAQLVGPLILLNLLLQALFAWLLLRRHAPHPVALWAGVALLAFPPTLFNRFIHVNLMAHWTILASLYLFLDPRRGERMRWWMPLIAVTALIHSYLLVMVGAIWAAMMLARLSEGSVRSRIVTVGQGAAMLVMVAMLALWLGVGDQVPTRSFGYFSMPLDALWNPGLAHFTRFLPAHEPYPGRYFEGFQYLGVGGLVLVGAAIVIAYRQPVRDGEDAVRQRLRRLAPALIALAMLAITSTQLPSSLQVALDPVRASGRLFWPVGYVMILMAVLSLFRLAAERAALALVGIVALQVIDLSGMALAVRAQSRDADWHQLYARTTDPRWEGLIRDAGSIAFLPGEVTRDLWPFQEIAWRAASAGKPVANVYAARTSQVTLRRLIAQRAAFDRGALVPDRLYVLLPGVPVPAAAGSRRLMIDGLTVIAPAAPTTISVAAARGRPL